MLDFYRKYWRTALDIGIIILTVYLIMWLFSWLYNLAAPILLALVIFVIIEPLARFLHKRGMSKLFATSISVLFYSGIVVALLAGLGVLFVTQTNRLIEMLPSYANVFQFHVSDLLAFLRTEWDALPANVTAEIQEYASSLSQSAANFAQKALTTLLGAIGSFSNFVVNFAMAFILAFFLSLEASQWSRIAREKTPRTFKKAFYFLRDNVLKGIINYIKALFKLMTITFVIILVSLLLLGVDNALAISLLAALLDILPLLGISVLFIPWIIYLFIVGNTWLAVWLTVILVGLLALRQILEPRIMGNSLGVSAFTMLALMVLSTSIFGIAGLILSPILTVLIKALYDQGYLKKWIRMPEGEFEDQPEELPADTNPPVTGQK
jgi:sporulation integral membrane protein YtvI